MGFLWGLWGFHRVTHCFRSLLGGTNLLKKSGVAKCHIKKVFFFMGILWDPWIRGFRSPWWRCWKPVHWDRRGGDEATHNT